jgi:hypothetical protein
MKKANIVALATVAGAIGLGIAACGPIPQSPPMSSLTPPPTYFNKSSTPSSNIPVKASGPATSVADGTYEVGVDIQVGKYKGQCPAFAYWARLRSDNSTDIISNNVLTNPGQMTFTVNKGEYVEVRGCTFSRV